MSDVKQSTNALKESGVAPLKSMYRTSEKAAFRTDGCNFCAPAPGGGSTKDRVLNADCVLDIVRGSLIFEKLSDFTTALTVIQAKEDIVIHRVKDRFSTPTNGGWRDCMVNLSFASDPDAVICEVQLIHQKLMLARKGMAGHSDYVMFRGAMEMTEAGEAAAQSGKTMSTQAEVTETKAGPPTSEVSILRGDNAQL